MAIELRQFHQTFFDESLEGLANMETALLRLESLPRIDAVAERETLHAIFRVVHSIKGGSGTFGFGWLTDFSHLLEHLLDDLRDGTRALDKRLLNLLLRAVDCLRNLIDAVRHNTVVDKTAVEDVTHALEQLHQQAPVAANTSASETAANMLGWRITFKPAADLFRSGNDPLRILKELTRLGTLTVRADLSGLPAWRQFDAENCYLGWMLELHGAVSRADIDEVFSWVLDSGTLEIVPIEEGAPAASEEPLLGQQHTMVRAHGTSLRVSTHKVDTLMDVVGELVITQTMLQQTATDFTPDDLPRLLNGLALLERNVRELQESVMSIRLLPLSFLFSRLPRLVRDLGESLGKRIELRIAGENTELDKTVIERISDPILHMVRNSVDHGLESPAERAAAGKPAVGTIRISATQKGGNVILDVEDDGRGLDYDRIHAKAVALGLLPANVRLAPEQLHELIFMPGMSTSESITDLSGRGVGLDVVRNNVRSLGGNIEVSTTRGRGTRFSVRLPLTLAILDGLSLQVGEQTYILPLVSITESIRLAGEDLQRLPGGGEIFLLRKDYLPLVRLGDLFGVSSRTREVSQGTVVIIDADGSRAGLLVDEILGQQQVVIKSLETNYRRIEGIAAATILGDGTVSLILDAGGLIRLTGSRTGSPIGASIASAGGAGIALH